MEAILLAGGKAERLGDAAQGRPKALVDVAGRPLAEYQIRRLAAAGINHLPKEELESFTTAFEQQFRAETSA